MEGTVQCGRRRVQWTALAFAGVLAAVWADWHVTVARRASGDTVHDRPGGRGAQLPVPSPGRSEGRPQEGVVPGLDGGEHAFGTPIALPNRRARSDGKADAPMPMPPLAQDTDGGEDDIPARCGLPLSTGLIADVYLAQERIHALDGGGGWFRMVKAQLDDNVVTIPGARVGTAWGGTVPGVGHVTFDIGPTGCGVAGASDVPSAIISGTVDEDVLPPTSDGSPWFVDACDAAAAVEDGAFLLEVRGDSACALVFWANGRTIPVPGLGELSLAAGTETIVHVGDDDVVVVGVQALP